MRAFSELLTQIEQTNSTTEKVDRMAAYFRSAAPEDGAWALYFLAGRRPKKFLSSKKLRAWAEDMAGIPAWLAEECYSAVGDTAELVALLVAPHRDPFRETAEATRDATIAEWMFDRIDPLRNAAEEVQRRTVQEWWGRLSAREIFVLNKLITGALRIGVSESLVYRALSDAFGISRSTIAARLLGQWSPSAEFFLRVTRVHPSDDPDAPDAVDDFLPVPFCLAASLEGSCADLGSVHDWVLEWKWDGIRAQVVKARGKIEIWSRGEERITDSFPELVELFARMAGDFTLDGEIVAGAPASPRPFSDLQKRLNRKKPTASLVQANPAGFLAYDLLRHGIETLTDRPLEDRRERLEEFMARSPSRQIAISPRLNAADWEAVALLHAQSRERRAEGLMIKRKTSPYVHGRKRGVWLKWKVDPLTLDVVLTAAQPGSGRRASLYTDYTFGIWKGDVLVPIAKAYSGLTDEELREVDQWIRKNTVDRYGPVRILKPERVFEIGFEGISESSRHKSGYAVRFPRILRERTDKSAAESDRLETVRELFKSLGSPAADSSPESL